MFLKYSMNALNNSGLSVSFAIFYSLQRYTNINYREVCDNHLTIKIPKSGSRLRVILPANRATDSRTQFYFCSI